MYEARDLLSVILKAGVCDIDFLINKLNELDVEFYDVFEEVKELGRESDFNSYVYYRNFKVPTFFKSSNF